MNTIAINNRRKRLERGWTKLSPTLGVHSLDGVGVRFYADAHTEFWLKAWGIDQQVVMVPRQVLTVRPDTPHLKPFYFPQIGNEDFRVGSDIGISPYGDDEPIHLHDRIIQRCPLGLYDMATGRAKWSGAPNYDLTRFQALPGYSIELVASPAGGLRPYDGQHLVRAMRVALHPRHAHDPFVRADLAMLLHDAKLCWQRRCAEFLKDPPHVGHPGVGREAAWVAIFACVVGDEPFKEKLRALVRHVQHPLTGIVQRITPETAGGMNPHPYNDSGVSVFVAVCQGIEMDLWCLAMRMLGMHAEAEKLEATVLAQPKRKWLGVHDGQGYGDYGADASHAWIGLSSLAMHDKAKAVQCAKRWPVPKPAWMGGSVGPFSDLAQIRAALTAWDDEAKSRPFLEATA